jgi:cephalosporin hydroxylase
VNYQLLRVTATALRDGLAPLRLARRAIRDFGAIQRTWELQSLIGLVRRLRPPVVVEIGTHRGGTLVCWAAVAAPAAHLISIDMISAAEGLGARDEDFARVRGRLQPGQTLTAINGDSHAPETRRQLGRVLAGALVDLLWIDGDHSYDGVKQDFDMYGPLVRSGGLIAFHDIRASTAFPAIRSPVFWEEVRTRHRTRELIANPAPGSGMGIGIIYV